MPSVVALALALATLAGPLGGRPLQTEPLVLELRVFLGAQDVTSDTRVTLHRAGERTSPVAQSAPGSGRLEFKVPSGIYDAQAIREVDGKVANIRWAERLVVMPYPDEGGHHLEVVNFTNGFGALQIRNSRSTPLSGVSLYKAGQHDRPAATPVDADGYSLFVVPSGRYDVQVGSGTKATWHTDVEVPLDRTRLWLVP